MAQAEHRPDPLVRDLDEAYRLYQLLAAKVPPAAGTSGRRPAPASRPPLQVDMVSHMAALEQALGWWISTARWLLDPVTRIELTDREGITCPHCGAKLVAWLRPGSPEAGEIVCCNPVPHHDPPGRWAPDQWPRLGILAGVHTSARYGPKLQVVMDA